MFKKILFVCLFLFSKFAGAAAIVDATDAQIGFQKTEKIVEFLAEYKKQKGYYPADLQEMDKTLIDEWLRERKFIYLPIKNATSYAMGFEGRGFLLFFSFRCARGPETAWQCSAK